MGFALAPDETLRILQTQLGQSSKERGEKNKQTNTTQNEIKKWNAE